MGLGWDDLIDEELVNKARRWFKELSELNDVKVPRCLRLKGEESVVEIKLHIFADASQEAYGAVVFSRCVYKQWPGIQTFSDSEDSCSPVEDSQHPSS